MTRTVLGALLIISGGGFCGLLAVCGLGRRTRILAALAAAIDYMQSEIEFCLNPLPMVMGRLASRYPELSGLFGPCSKAITSELRFEQAWERALKTSGLPLRQDERQTLLELGAVLGRYDAGGQLNALEQARRGLMEMARRARTEQTEKSRLFGFAGFAAGLILTILIV